MTPASLTFDIVVVLICCAVLLYCQLLARRLRALHTLKSGVGEAIVNLSGAIKQSTEANEKIASDALEALASLDTAMAQIREERQAAADLLETLDGQIHRAKRTLGTPLETAQKTAERLTSLTERARIEMDALTKAVAITNKVSMLVTSRKKQALAEARVHPLSPDADAPISSNPYRSSATQAG